MKHLDLFSGIGGFALAAQTVWGAEYECVGFCDNNYFCQQVLSKNFPGVPIYDDIRTLTNSQSTGQCTKQKASRSDATRQEFVGCSKTRCNCINKNCNIDLITGGFPCQPFSAAGKRKGTADDRYLWPEMFRVIREFKPTWVIAENVKGLTTWSEGMVLEQVCTDLESQGYEVQPFIIPACGVNAPHRRERIWIVANRTDSRTQGMQGRQELSNGTYANSSSERLEGSDRSFIKRCAKNSESTSYPKSERVERIGGEKSGNAIYYGCYQDWSRNWREVAFATCNDSMDARFPSWLAGLPLSVYDTMMGYGTPSYTRTAKSLSSLQTAIQSEEIQRKIGGLYEVEGTLILLEIMRQYILRIEQRQKLSRPMAENEHQERCLQSMWLEEIRQGADRYPSYRWEHHEQQSQELSNIVPFLSHEDAQRIAKEGHYLWLLFKNLHPQAVSKRVVRLPDGNTITYAKWRQEALKAYGNAIVPQVAMEIMKSIKLGQ